MPHQKQVFDAAGIPGGAVGVEWGQLLGQEGVEVSLEACDAISMTHKKSGNVQDIRAALKKNASKDV